MPEFEVDHVTYRLRPVTAVQEWAFYTLLVPVLPILSQMEVGFRAAAQDGGDRLAALLPLADVEDDVLISLFAACRKACERDVDGAWVMVDEALPMQSLVSLLMAVSRLMLDDFFNVERTNFRPETRDGVAYDSVTMASGRDWLWRPVVRGLCRAESIYDGTLRLAQVAELNDVLAVHDENEYRARRAAERDAEIARRRN